MSSVAPRGRLLLAAVLAMGLASVFHEGAGVSCGWGVPAPDWVGECLGHGWGAGVVGDGLSGLR